MRRRNFLKGLAASSIAGLVEPKFLFAQGAGGGRIKNFVHIFLYGGADGRFFFPYTSGPMDPLLRTLRPGTVPAAEQILQISNMNQNGRSNTVGFHPNFAELVSMIETTGSGATIFTEYGVTAGNVFSHEAAQTHYQMGSTRSPQTLHQGWLAKLSDVARLPFYSVWGIGETSPMMFNTYEEKPLVLSSNLASFKFANRNFGNFKTSTAATDSVYSRHMARRLANVPHPEIPLDQAITKNINSIYPSVALVQNISSTAVDMTKFNSASGASGAFQTAMSDIAKIIKYANSASAPTEVQSNMKILCTAIGGWDAHSGINGAYYSPMIHLGNSIKGLIYHLKQWGLLDSTVILVHTEFGRTTRLNSSAGLDHAAANLAIAFGGKVKRSVMGPDPSMDQANSINYFTPQVAFTGVIKEILRAGGFSNDTLTQVFSDSFPGESGLDFISA